MEETVRVTIFVLVIFSVVVTSILSIHLVLHKKEVARLQQELVKQSESYKELVKEQSKTALAKSRSVLKGQIAEQMFGLLASNPYKLEDMRFSGQPIDYIVFDGLSECAETGRIDQVVLIDVKTGNARLSKTQQLVKEAIADKRVRFETFRIDDAGCLHKD